MQPSFIEPLGRAWSRVEAQLFRPFAVETWLVVGFAAFIARLVEGGFARTFAPGLRFESPWWTIGAPVEILERWRGAPAWFLLGAPLFALGLLLLLVLLWLSSRGKFVFLDDLAHGRAAIVEPWNRWRAQGDSLFLWRLGFYLLCLAAMAAAFWPVVLLGSRGFESGLLHALGAVQFAASSLLWLALALTAALVLLLLDDFVVPIMLRHTSTTTEAWRRLVSLISRHPLEFGVYVLLVVLARVTLALCLALLALLTCCIAPLLLAIPYVGSVLLLPVSALYRLYSAEFLAQFGPDFDVLGPAPTAAPPAPTVPPAPAPPAPPA